MKARNDPRQHRSRPLLTIIRVPFGIASFKMAGLSLAPFKKEVIHRDQLPSGTRVMIGDITR